MVRGFLLALVVSVTAAAQPVHVQRGDGDRFVAKMGRIVENSIQRKPRALRTAVSESELNSYLNIQARDAMPVGLLDPRISILGSGQIAARALVDVEAARKQQGAGGWFDPLSYLGRRVPVVATGRLQTKNGVGRLSLQSVEISGVSVPKGLLQQLVSYYSRTPENPNGIDLEAPFELPARIREIEVQKGQAIVVQ